MKTVMTAMQRVEAALSHRAGDRVPFFLLFTMHGAQVTGCSLRDYFHDAASMAEGQRLLQRRFGHDCHYAFTYAAAEMEAWGGETLFVDDGPPVSAAPVLRSWEEIDSLAPPRLADSPALQRALDLIARLQSPDVPVVGVVMSPFSLPIMQLGFETYLQLLYEQPERFEQLMRVNIEFCVEWANAQFAAGATALCYFDPVASPAIVPRDLYLRTGHRVACATLPRLHGPVATHLASARTLPILDDLAVTGTTAVAAGNGEDLVELRRIARGRFTLVGNLSGVDMTWWTPEQARAETRDLLAKGGGTGGFILADSHGEIPFHVPLEVLDAIADEVRCSVHR